ncbi:MAG: hypothetical protein KGJ63_09180, partial [Pseudomonadota bacterium]|nr:hypothetical protein [Pseudomonadota bacterium]
MNLLWVVAAPLCAQSTPEVVRITIHAYWAGYSPYTPRKTDLIVERQGHGYRLTGIRSGRKFGKPEPLKTLPPQDLSADQIAQLVAALRAPPETRVDLKAIGVTGPQAQQSIDRAWVQLKMAKLPLPIRTKADAFRDSLRNPAALAEVITRGFAAYHSDDYPYVAVKVELSDGSALSVFSSSQQYLMLPWKNALGQASYDADIPHAV